MGYRPTLRQSLVSCDQALMPQRNVCQDSGNTYI